MAVMVPTNVTIIQGIKISVGLLACCEARMAITLMGMMFKPAACKHRNMICASEALSLFGLISCRLAMAFSPKGVAALSKSQQVGRKIHNHMPHGRVSFGHARKEPSKKMVLQCATAG